MKASVWVGLGIIGVGAALGLNQLALGGKSGAISHAAAHEDQDKRAGDGRRPEADRERDSAAMRAQLAGLSEEVALLRQQVASKAQAIAPTPDDAPAPAAIPREQAIANQDREWHEHMSAIQTQFEAESRDANWSTVASSAVLDAVRADQAISETVRNLDCHSKTCRFEVSGDRRTVGRSLLGLFRKLAPVLPTAQTDQIVGANGEQTTVVYLSRENTARASVPTRR